MRKAASTGMTLLVPLIVEDGASEIGQAADDRTGKRTKTMGSALNWLAVPPC
jgi:hypothetical protein